MAQGCLKLQEKYLQNLAHTHPTGIHIWLPPTTEPTAP